MTCVDSFLTPSAINGVKNITKLNDNLNGTYSTNLNFNLFGSATISVLQSARQGITAKYYNSLIISGTLVVTNTSSYRDINFSYTGSQEITPGHYEDVAVRLTSQLMTFKTETCNLTLRQDDGANLKINGVTYIDKYGMITQTSDTFGYNFNAFEIYNLEIDWSDQTNVVYLELYWDCGNGNTLIPPENYAIAQDIGGNPLQISVGCFDKYEQTPSTTNQCRTQCGDGFVIDTEVCDYGNIINDDGCAEDCRNIELGWECDQASPTICKKINKSNTLTNKDKAIGASVLSAMSIPVILNIIGKILNQASRNSVFSSFNQLQLLMLLLLLEIHLPASVINYLRSLSSSLIPISIDWGSFPGFRTVWKWFDYPQERTDFGMIDISSGSTIINLNTLVGIFVAFLITHLFVAAFLI